MQPDVALVLDGREYRGWTEVRIVRTLDSLVGSFDLALSPRESTGAERWPLRAGGPCEIRIEGELAITGYVDRLGVDLDGEDYVIRVSGRDKAGDLVDCSPVDFKPRRNVAFQAVVNELVKPFGIAAAFGAGASGTLPKFAVQQGESVWSAIERLARFKGLALWSEANGTIRLDNPGQGAAGARLVEGENILSITAAHDVADRFSEYHGRAQRAGSDTVRGKAAALIKAESRDSAVERYRPMLIVAEDQASQADLKKRLDWEANVRAARAQQASVAVPGWFDSAGARWDFNRRVGLDAPSAFISAEMLITTVELTRDAEDGTRAALTLARPDAWTPAPPSGDVSQLGDD